MPHDHPRTEPGGIFRKLMQVAADYIRQEHIERYHHLHHHIRGLPREEACLILIALIAAAVVVVATPLLASYAPHLPGVIVQEERDQAGHITHSYSIPVVGLALTFVALSIGWGYLMGGAAQSPGPVWIAIGVTYVFLVFGFSLGIRERTPITIAFRVLPIVLPVVLGGVTPGGQTWGKLVVAVIAAKVVLTTLPRPDALHPWYPDVHRHWYYWWPVAAAILITVEWALARRPWPSVPARVGLAAFVTLGYLGMIWWALPLRDIAAAADLSLNLALGYLIFFWFMLGASFVTGALSMAIFARKSIETIVSRRWLPWVLGAGWVALVAWTLTAVPVHALQGHPNSPIDLPYRHIAAAVLLLLLAVLAVVRVRGKVTGDWLAGWFVASVAAALVLNTYAHHDVRAVIQSNAGAYCIAAFMYAVVWGAAGRIRHIPAKAAGFVRPSLLLLYLGVLIFVSTVTMFGLAANIVIYQQYSIVYEYLGASSLWIPLSLLAAVGAWPFLPSTVVGRSVTAFLAGAGIGVLAFVLRGLIFPELANPLILALLSATVVALLRGGPEMHRGRYAAVLGLAAALGCAVSLSQRVLVDLLQSFIFGLGLLLHPDVPAVVKAGIALRQWSDDAFHAGVWQTRYDLGWDLAVYYGLAPLLTVLVAIGYAAFCRVRSIRPVSESGSRS